MAKKTVTSTKTYSLCDQYLIEILLEPVKTYKTKRSSQTPIQQSDELLQYILSNKPTCNIPTSSLSTAA